MVTSRGEARRGGRGGSFRASLGQLEELGGARLILRFSAGMGVGEQHKSERGAAEQSCAHRGPAPGSVGGSGYSRMWPWRG